MYVSVCLCVVTYDPSVESVFVVLQHFPFLSLSKPHFLCLLPISLYLLVLVFVGCFLFLSHILVFFIQRTLSPPPLPLLPFTIYWVLSISISRIEIPVQFCASLINLKHWYELICVLDTVFVVIFYFYVLGLFNLS